MPLYMDIHSVDTETFSVEDVVKAHMEDVAIQDQFGVSQIKYWVNEDTKTIFCLMKGPNKEACNEVHKQSHGGTACNIIEVTDDEFNLYLGTGNEIGDLAHTTLGEIDTGYRTILMVKIIDFTKEYKEHEDKIYKIIKQYEGSIILLPEEEILTSFVYASKAIQCASIIGDYLKSIVGSIEFTLALSSGKPVAENGNNLFDEAKRQVQQVCTSSKKNTMSLDIETKLLFEKENTSYTIAKNEFKIVQSEDFQFLFKLFTILNKNLYNPYFNNEQLYSLMGLSKSHLYRDLKTLTGMAPNKLIQELRLKQSLKSIRKNNKNISETAYSLGFNSPTYFTKIFRKRFGLTPSLFIKAK